MSNEEVVELFYGYLNEFECGLMNLIHQIGDEYQDVKQNALERLIKANNKYGIKDNKAKGLMFITLRNCLINTNNKRIKEHTVNIDVITEKPSSTNELSQNDDDLKEQLLLLITSEEYDLLLDYFNNRYLNKFDPKLNHKIQKIKNKMGWSKQWELIKPNGETKQFKWLTQVARHIGINEAQHLSKLIRNGKVCHNGLTYRINPIIKLKKIK